MLSGAIDREDIMSANQPTPENNKDPLIEMMKGPSQYKSFRRETRDYKEIGPAGTAATSDWCAANHFSISRTLPVASPMLVSAAP